MTKLIIFDAFYGELNLEGDILEETETYLTLKQGLENKIIWKHNILERWN